MARRAPCSFGVLGGEEGGEANGIKSRALLHVAKNLISYLGERKGTDGKKFVDNLTHILNLRRAVFNWRLAVVAASASDIAVALSLPSLEPQRALYNLRLAFVFTGQGAHQWFAIGRELMDQSLKISSRMLCSWRKLNLTY